MEQTTKPLHASRLGLPLIAGRFRRLSLLGEGGMGRIYEVYDHERHRRLALKEMRCATPMSLLLFKNEFRALRDIRHDNLVRLHELFESDDEWYFTLDLVEGVDFLSWVRPRMPRTERPVSKTAVTMARALERSELPTVPRRAYLGSEDSSSGERQGSGVMRRRASDVDEGKLRRSFSQLAAGIAALHRAGKVHRDIKPSNILVESHSGRVVVLDFGLVTDAETAIARDTGNIIGTVKYMAPEQAVGEPATPASDWYAVGLLLYRALTGRPAFLDSTELVFAKRNACFPPPSAVASGVPEGLAQLCIQMLAGTPAERPTEDEILRTLGVPPDAVAKTRSRSGIFVGRSEELQALESAHREVVCGVSTTVIIQGESGVGKSALAEAFLARLLRPGQPTTLVLRGRCHERETVPYNAFDRVIDELAWCVSALSTPLAELLGPRAVAALVMLFPALGVSEGTSDSPPGPRPRRSDDIELRRLAVDGLVALLDHLGRSSRLVIAIDDAHWADADSLSLLRALTHAFEQRRVLLLLTMRSHGPGPAPQDRVLASLSGAVHHLHVGRLPPAQARALLLAIAKSGRPIDEDAILDEAGGHPMFLDELVRQRDAGEHAGSTTDLDGALRARVRRLSPEAQHLVEYVAVAGAPIANAALARAANFPAAGYDDTMDELQAARLVRFNGAQHGDYAEPYHDRVREALTDCLPGPRKVEMHTQLALALEGSAGGTPEVLARHYDAAGNAAQTVRYALRAADAAAAAFAFDRAAQFYRMAIRSGAMTSAVGSSHHEALARVLQCAGRAREAADAYAQAGMLADGLRRLQLRRKSAEQLLMGGYVKAGREALNADLREARLRELRPVSFVVLLQVLWGLLRCRFAPARWRARGEAEVDPAAIHRIDICWSAAAGMSMVDTVSGMLFAIVGLRLSLRAGEPFRVARACTTVSTVASALGEASLSLSLCERAEAAAAEHGGGIARCYPVLARIVHEFLVNHDLNATIERSDQFLNAWRDEGMGRGFESDFACQFKSWAQAMRGDIARVRQTVAELVHVAAQSDNRFLFVALRAYHVLPYLADDRPADAERDVRDAIGSWLDPDAFQLPHCWAAISLSEVALYTNTLTIQDVRRWWKVRRSVFWHVRWVRIRLLDVCARACLARAVTAREEGSRVVSWGWRNVAWWSSKRLCAESGAGPVLGGIVAAGLAAFSGDVERGATLLTALLPRLEERAWNLHSAVVLRQIGRTRGGEAGMALMRTGETWLAKASVKRPERLSQAFLPGWPRVGDEAVAASMKPGVPGAPNVTPR